MAEVLANVIVFGSVLRSLGSQHQPEERRRTAGDSQPAYVVLKYGRVHLCQRHLRGELPVQGRQLADEHGLDREDARVLRPLFERQLHSPGPRHADLAGGQLATREQLVQGNGCLAAERGAEKTIEPLVEHGEADLVALLLARVGLRPARVVPLEAQAWPWVRPRVGRLPTNTVSLLPLHDCVGRHLGGALERGEGAEELSLHHPDDHPQGLGGIGRAAFRANDCAAAWASAGIA
mmetsp:Transcript_102040/g.304473  ORF Transcript_102040/g.304473 Transcript_102040/m.304473 type:complete len:235 (-) Transcript_102040:182-886(-)